MELYHVTGTGRENEVLESFLTEGASSKIAQGHGQGAGFYVFTDISLARAHVRNLKSPSGLFNPGVKKEGELIVLKLEERLDTENWDVDYESQAPDICRLVYENFDLFKTISDGAISVDGYELLPSRSELYPFKNLGIVMKDLETGKEKTHSTVAFDDNDVDTYEGKLFGAIFNYMQREFPDFAKKVEGELFRTAKAVKYVGDDPLEVVDVEHTGVYL